MSSLRFIERHLDPHPKLPELIGILSVAATVVCMGYGGLLGPVSIVAFYAIWLPRIRYRGARLIKPGQDIFIFIFPLFACLSAAWSKYPTTSLYTGLEYTSTAVCALLMARLTTTSSLVRGLVLGIAGALLASLINGRYATDAFSGRSSLIGLFGSKNMVGIFSEIGVIASLFCLSMKQKFPSRLVWGIVPLLLCTYTLHLSKSASSVLSLLVVIGLLVTLLVITRLPKVYRGFSFSIITVWLLVLVVTAGTIGVQDEVLQSFGKSTTLTGRTTLWEKGVQTGWDNPVIGMGYSAFWVKGNILAEHFWYKFGVKSRSGFHFHNTFIQVFVELGITGVLMVGWMFLFICLSSLRRILARGMELEAALVLSLAVMFVTRSFVEVDVVGTFNIGPLLFYMLLPRLRAAALEKDAATAALSAQSAGALR